MRLNLMSLLAVAGVIMTGFVTVQAVETVDLQLRYQVETRLYSGRFHRLVREEQWKPEETAIIVCDVWDLHHCRNAVRRVEEFAPRLDQVLKRARSLGISIIHSPSGCMSAYVSHPARKRAVKTPNADFIPHECDEWCSVIPSEERAVYPIDQSDGGEDDDPVEHAEWASHLKDLGRDPRSPWKSQSDLITIDSQRDFISDRGTEVWNILQAKGIRNVILTGVHTNMCVLGRPFGLRQMSRNGMNVVLMRDMTDTMYNPQRWPYVSHFTGTDLIVSHIERCVCPTVTSDQFIGGQSFRFSKDTRPHLVMLVAEREYRTNETLPAFAATHLGRDFRVTTVFGSATERNSLPGIESVADADVLLVSVRRRVLPAVNLKWIRDHVAAGKPVIGIRTASHAFSLRDKQVSAGFEAWPEFDAEVFGGSYSTHHGNDLKSTVAVTSSNHPITDGLTREPFPQGGSLYQTSPLTTGTVVLSTGTIAGLPTEPVSWTFTRADGGRSFYTSMGHVDDFRNPQFTQLLYQAICWASKTAPSEFGTSSDWITGEIPSVSVSNQLSREGDVWLRCAFRLPPDWADDQSTLNLNVQAGAPNVSAWVNGHRLSHGAGVSPEFCHYPFECDRRSDGEANLLVIRCTWRWLAGLRTAPVIEANGRSLCLKGRWQMRAGAEENFAGTPLAGKFAVPPDIVFSPPEPLWTARPLTKANAFTSGIEGPACDPTGNILAVNYEKQGTIGRVSPDGSAELYMTLPQGSTGNGIRFDPKGDFFFVADYTGHNVLKVDPNSREVMALAHDDRMNQPNDLAIAPDGTLYASDPAWGKGTGQLWRIDMNGTVTRLAQDLGTTNGVEVSPDGKTLYVNESVQRNVWAFDITTERLLANKRLVRQFPEHGFDGMRCDVDGNLYITRPGEGTVIRMSPQGEIIQKVNVLGSHPTNLCFGGPDGCTVYVTQVDGGRLVSFRTDRPGRAWAERQAR
ncbi:MAG: isochorismatase family protein [Fuerstiella sp.]|nr:isochorismatase family protein [Fuerstiella sp.]